MTVNIEGLGKITATKEVLNEISMAFSSQAVYYKFHVKESPNTADARSYAIHIALAKAGYYDNLD